MKRIVSVFCIISVLVGISYGLIQPGDVFPPMRFDLSSNKSALQYLQIKKAKAIDISEINADVLIVEVLSVYCVSCMTQAPFDKKLFSMIESDGKTSGKVKMIGIGVGNSSIAVNNFINRYKTPYPVIADPKFLKYDQIGQVRTPFKLILKKINNNWHVIKTEVGVNKDIKGTYKVIVDILEGVEVGEERVELKAIEKKQIEKSLVEELLKEWLSQRGEAKKVEELFIDSGETVYKIGSKEERFAVLINRVAPCDVCKDVQFIYIIDNVGNIIDFLPIQLSKKYNIPFDENDFAKVKGPFMVRNISENIEFDATVDAVTSATITSALIYDSINKGARIFRLLKEKGYIIINK